MLFDTMIWSKKYKPEFSFSCDGDDNTRIQAVVSHGVVPSIVALFGHENNSVVRPEVSILGNFVSGNDE